MVPAGTTDNMVPWLQNIRNYTFIILKHYSKIGCDLSSHHVISTFSQLCIFLAELFEAGKFGTDHHFVCQLGCLDQPDTPGCANLLFFICQPKDKIYITSPPWLQKHISSLNSTTMYHPVAPDNLDKAIPTHFRAITLFTGSVRILLDIVLVTHLSCHRPRICDHFCCLSLSHLVTSLQSIS